jgi:hypothetical protein
LESDGYAETLGELMIKKLLAGPVALAMVLLVCSVPAFADVPKANELANSPEAPVASEKTTSKANTKLEKDMKRLIADSKAGKVAPKPQMFPATGHNLSKTAKIAIIASAAFTVIFLSIMFHQLSKD